MPQPIIFQRAPLVQSEALPLNPGQVLLTGELFEQILSSVPEHLTPDCLEGAVRLSACGADAQAQAAVSAALQAQIGTQAEDGSFPLSMTESLAVCRAAWFQAMESGDRGLFSAVNRWLNWLGGHYELLQSEAAILRRPADLAELLLLNYRQLGTQGALRLLARLRRDAEDWASRLGSFSLDRPVNRRQMEEGLAQADSAQRAYWERMAELSDPAVLADGFRAVHCFSRYSGNRTEAEAGERAWSRISRWHGVACGGVTGVDRLAGKSPAALIGPDAAGAWMEALAPYAADGESWAADALERILVNALPAVTGRGACAVNRIPDGEKAAAPTVTGRLLRGFAAAAQAAVAAETDGCTVRAALPGVYGLLVNGERVRLRITCAHDALTVGIHPDHPAKMRLTVRVPAWMEQVHITLNGAECGTVRDGSCTLEQTWRDGDRLTVSFTRALRVESGYHQSLAVYDGPVLMALPVQAGEPWAFCLAGAGRKEEGGVEAELIPVEGWRAADGQPADVPVLPKHCGESVRRTLVPFASPDAGMAVFAGNAKA
ncbi:MAG: glycoside hydrolase family 127 protein [Clostridia bacterium]|nr:glycoside hydrolase family 127 protein [Clostridia bacterium]